jgi:hypothetical protein
VLVLGTEPVAAGWSVMVCAADASRVPCSRGPSKKELKEQQKAQEEEMLALFNAVPKKKDDTQVQQAELDPDTGPTFTDITQEIEYQRANVVAKTKITDAVFQCDALRLAHACACMSSVAVSAC